MSRPSDVQADVLLDDIRRQVAAERRQLLDAAAGDAEQVLARARAKARRQVQRAVDEMRGSAEQRRQALAAQLETAQRQQATARATGVLAAAWPLLEAAIAQRWRAPHDRARWLRAQLQSARQRWPRSHWLLRHPGDWSVAEVEALRDAAAQSGHEALALQADPSLDVGLVIECDGARLDSRPAALLVDRARVEAALLAALVRSRDVGDE